MKLVITEKPSVARAIAEVIGANGKKNGYMEGNGYYVSWCIGHLITLCNADAYDKKYQKWVLEDLPIIPQKWQHRILEDTKVQYDILKKLLNSDQVTEVICATDAGREGELIFRLVYNASGCTKPIKRLWISSMEESAIEAGFAHLGEGKEYEPLYRSALCRSQADWLVGINATRLFTTLYHKKLTVGRVQTPILAMLVERELKIRDFQKEKYFKAHILFNGVDAATNRIDDQNEAEKVARICQHEQACVVSIDQETKNLEPPKLYDLTTLQREANRLFGYTAQQTLDYTQSLYEKKLVTYPRTDSCYLTDDMEETANQLISRIFKQMSFAAEIRYQPDVKRILDSQKVSDHHAIIPTMEIEKNDLSSIPKMELNILSLIAQKLLCATADCQITDTTRAVFECAGVPFHANGKTVKEPGWKKIEEAFKETIHLKEETGDEKEQRLPELSVGMRFDRVESKVTAHDTTPPKAFTEDTLLAAMETAGSEALVEEVERKGLGTPATRAAIIEKLILSKFIERQKKSLIPTADGISLIEILPDTVKSPELTAEWENSLSLIARGEEKDSRFMMDIEKMVGSLVQTYRNQDVHAAFQREGEAIGMCPKCANQVFESKTNFYCENRGCNFSLFKENNYFASMKKTITKSIASDFIKDGRSKVKGLYSRNKDKKFDATIIMDASGQYVQFRMEFEPKHEHK